MEIDPKHRTGHYYDGHSVRSGKQGEKRRLKIRRARRNYRRLLGSMSSELGDIERITRYLKPARRLR